MTNITQLRKKIPRHICRWFEGNLELRKIRYMDPRRIRRRDDRRDPAFETDQKRVPGEEHNLFNNNTHGSEDSFAEVHRRRQGDVHAMGYIPVRRQSSQEDEARPLYHD